VGCAYVTNSGFNVTVDNPELNRVFMYCLIAQQVAFCAAISKFFFSNLAIVRSNKAYIQEQIREALDESSELFEVSSAPS
jgi:hypothetical protein